MPFLYDQFFTLREAGKYSCNLCGVIISGTAGKTSNLNKHLRNLHKDHRDAANTAKLQAERALQSRVDEFGAAALKPYDRDSARHKAITKDLVRAVADSYLPLAVVDRPSFRRLVVALNPRYDMPHRKGVTEAVVAEGEKCKRELLDMLAGATTVTVTLDLWTNRRMKSFLGETVHFITEKKGKLAMETFMLACRRFEDRHTATNIAWHHQEVMEDYRITSKVVVAVTDSAANMKKAFSIVEATSGATTDDGTLGADEDLPDEATSVDDLDLDDELDPVSVAQVLDSDASHRPVASARTACACHTLQLTVQDSLKALPGSVSRTVARINSFVASVKRSTVAAEVIDICLIMERHGAFLHVANATRWNSQLRAIQSYLALSGETLDDLKDAVPAIAAKTIDETSRKAMEELVEILMPLAEATEELQKEKEPTGSSVLPTVRILRLRLSQLVDQPHSQLSRMAKTLLDSLNSRFQQYWIPLFQAATFLDPRWKLAVLSPSAVERAQIRTEVEDELVSFLYQFRPPVEAPSPVETTTTVAAPQRSSSREEPEPPTKRGFFDLLDEEEDQPPAAPQTIRERLVVEMDAYIQEAREDREAGRALAYWSTQQAAKPLLRHCACHWLAIPASSAPSERLFSVGGRFFCPSRSRLSPRVFEGLMFVKSHE